MKKIILFNIQISILIATCSSYVYAESVQKYDTIAHDVLKIECKAFEKKPDYELLNKVIRTTTRPINLKDDYTKEDALKILQLLSNYLFQNKFIYIDKKFSLTGSLIPVKLTNDDIACILNEKEKKYVKAHPNEVYYRSNCLSQSIIFVTMGEVLNLPIHAVLAPRHVFVRWDFPDGTYVNWETTSNKNFPDSFYIENRKISDKAVENGVYLRSLNKKEVLSVAYDNISRYFAQKQSYDKALYFLNEAEKLNPRLLSVYDNRGIIFGRLKNYDESLENFTKAINMNPYETMAHTYRGLTYSHIGDYNKALDDLNEAIRIDSDFIEPYLKRGDTYMKMGEYTKSIDDYTTVIKKNPKNYDAYFYRGLCWLAEANKTGNKEDYAKAINDISKCIELRPFNVVLYANRALAYKKLGLENEAIADIEEAKKWGSYNKQLSDVLGKLNRKSNEL